MAKKILAIDPGTTESGYVCLTDFRRIESFGKFPNEEILRYMSSFFPDDTLVIEEPQCMGMAVGKSVFETLVWVGRFIERWSYLYATAQIHRIYRNEVKMRLCGHIKGVNDSTLRRYMLDVYGEQGTKKNPGSTYGMKGDVWQALALVEAYLRGKV